jgi:hypothetical protein
MSSEFRESNITIRGKLYRVRELDARTMAEVRRLIDAEKWRVEAFVTWKCCIDPPFASEKAALEEPHIVVDKVSSEAFRLSKEDEGDTKG